MPIKFSVCKRLKNSKKEGSILVATLFLSGLILLLGLSAAALMARELNLATDVLYSERAYYAAEGGIERALIALNVPNEGVQHIDKNTEALSGFAGVSDQATDSYYAIDNQVDSGEIFSFDLEPFGAQKFRFQYDDVSTLGFNADVSSDMQISVDPSVRYQWRFICQASDNRTYALVGSHTGNLMSIKNAAGLIEDSDPTDRSVNFSSWNQVCGEYQVTPGGGGSCITLLTMGASEKESCFLSIQNLDDTDVANFKFRAAGKAAPHLAEVSARATAGNRTKIIEFDYLQKNLGGLFDFSFYHNR